MLSFVQKYGGNIHSQNGEDSLIAECLRRLPNVNEVCVEIGANNGLWLSNTRALIERGWSALMVESNWDLYQQCVSNWKHNDKVRCQCCVVDGHNINAFVDDRCDVMSTDTEGADYDIFQGLKAKPKIVIVEIDSSLPEGGKDFNLDGGASYWKMLELGLSKGYFLLCHTGNEIFIDNKYRELFPEIEDDGLSNSELYFNRGWLEAAA